MNKTLPFFAIICSLAFSGCNSMKEQTQPSQDIPQSGEQQGEGGESERETIIPSNLVTLANSYIQSHKDDVDNSRKPLFHLSPLIGWMNDPNGFSEFNGNYNLFYQYYPYDAVWGSMHWGHQTTKDFIKWEHQSVALAPDTNYERGGCFSGTATTVGDKHYLVYTSVVGGKQNQSMAYSYDGINYKKLDKNPILSGKDLPEGFSNNDFRDPSIFKKGDKYFIICGNQDNKGNKQIICYRSDSIDGEYKYLGVTLSRQNVGGIFECPDFLTIDDKDILIASPQRISRSHDYHYQNDDSCIYKVGTFNPNTARLVYQGDNEFEEFDKGFSFYAPQTMQTSDGRHILTAWMKQWSETNITRADGWAGSMVLPRELTLKDDHIYQNPVRELANYFSNTTNIIEKVVNNESSALNDIKDRTCSISLEINVNESSRNAGIEVFKKGNESTRIYYDNVEKCVVFDRNGAGSLLNGIRKAKVDPIDGKIKLQVILDISCVEVFINDGYYTMTGNIFADEDYNEIALFSNTDTTFSNISYSHINI